jgi:CheY-like chemotaxis protein/GGDEF domain-containing protein
VNESERCTLTGFPTGNSLDNLIRETPSNGWAFFIRVDQIEHVNSVYGREEGDATFRRVGEIVSNTAPRPMYRGSGPVFVTTLIGDTADSLALAETLRKRVADSTELIEAMSVSVALVPADEASEVADIYASATRRLENARRRGGNTIAAVAYEGDEDDYTAGTVLIVDPDIEVLTVLIREIESRGITVLTSEDGLEALQIVSQFAPDVVISELSVPKIGGLELRSRLRNLEQIGNVPFVLLSHRQTDDLIREAASLRILHYYRKPVPALLIAELVHNLIRNRVEGERFG